MFVVIFGGGLFYKKIRTQSIWPKINKTTHVMSYFDDEKYRDKFLQSLSREERKSFVEWRNMNESLCGKIQKEVCFKIIKRKRRILGVIAFVLGATLLLVFSEVANWGIKFILLFMAVAMLFMGGQEILFGGYGKQGWIIIDCSYRIDKACYQVYNENNFTVN